MRETARDASAAWLATWAGSRRACVDSNAQRLHGAFSSEIIYIVILKKHSKTLHKRSLRFPAGRLLVGPLPQDFLQGDPRQGLKTLSDSLHQPLLRVRDSAVVE